MNLQPINGFMRSFPGDTHTLPVMTRLRSLIVDEDCIVESSFEDSNLHSTSTTGEGSLYLGARVVPMGWKSAVGLVQYIHKRLLRGSGLPLQMGADLPADREHRADRPLPLHDDFDVLELVSIDEERKRAPTDWQERSRRTYDHYRLPTSRLKAGVRERKSTRLGYELDGDLARLGVPPAKIGRLIGLTRYALEAPVTKRTLQVILGHWVHALMLRRECMGLLNDIWRVLLRLGTQARPLTKKVKLELAHALAALPLARVYMRSVVDPRLTASDANESGGGVCVTRGLSSEGLAAWGGNQVLRDHIGRDEVGLLTVGDNVGVVAMAATRVGSECCFHLALVTQPGGEQLLGAQFVMCDPVSTWECLSLKLEEALNRCPHAHRVLVVCMAEGVDCQLEEHLQFWRVLYPWLIWDLALRRSSHQWMTSWLAPQACAQKVERWPPHITAAEMEVALGLPKGFSLAILSKKDRSVFKTELEFLRKGVLQECVRVNVMAQLLRPWVEEVARWAGTPGTGGWRSGEPASDVMRAIMALTTHRGSDVRFDTQTVVDPRAKPWHSIVPDWWVSWGMAGGLVVSAWWSAH
eukprot:1384211-Amphidinium_carterae.1